jgi:purine-binding chemotaxis protein CheW
MSGEQASSQKEPGINFETLAGKYLTFQLGPEVYGLEILKVQEIIGLMHVTHVPRTPKFVRGVINLRGKVLPVIDLRSKFGMEEIDDTSQTCIIVLQVATNDNSVIMGVLVDSVSEVVDINANQLEPAPNFGSSIDTAFILAIGKIADKVVILLDVDKVLTINEIDHLVKSTFDS